MCHGHAVVSCLTSISFSVVSDSLLLHGLQTSRLLCPWNSPGMNTGVGSHALLQGIFPTQALNLSLLHCRQVLYHLSHQGSPRLSIKTVQKMSYLSLWHGVHDIIIGILVCHHNRWCLSLWHEIPVCQDVIIVFFHRDDSKCQLWWPGIPVIYIGLSYIEKSTSPSHSL